MRYEGTPTSAPNKPSSDSEHSDQDSEMATDSVSQQIKIEKSAEKVIAEKAIEDQDSATHFTELNQSFEEELASVRAQIVELEKELVPYLKKTPTTSDKAAETGEAGSLPDEGGDEYDLYEELKELFKEASEFCDDSDTALAELAERAEKGSATRKAQYEYLVKLNAPLRTRLQHCELRIARDLLEFFEIIEAMVVLDQNLSIRKQYRE